MQITGDTEKVPQETRMFLPVVLVYAIFAQKSTFAFTRGARRERLVPFTGADGVPPQSRPTRPAQGPSAEGPGALTGRFASLRARGFHPALTGSAAPHGGTSPPMYPPALRGSLEGRARSFHWGRRPVKFPSTLSKGWRGPGAEPRSPVTTGETPFRRAHFSLSNFLFERKKESWKPSALHRGRHPGRGTAGLLVTNGGSRLELKSPTGRCQGGARAAHQKHPGGMFLRPQNLHGLKVPPLVLDFLRVPRYINKS